ncbi:CRISPR-associated helicase Cas3' [Siccirubricoccus phaeus]|uniref:CRISPR-associated helicase Cas3' n=1 Tax=Siccirubricoccus phaeus TaxID=2595053 RepID=UPI00165B2848|nr:CRISPR-associated helicase Cas3' [Siccirubricoccus phaeus]
MDYLASALKPSTALFWGKAQPAEADASAMHPLVAHALEVAAVGVLLGQSRGLKSRGLKLPGKALGFLLALHDIGKFSRPFQAMAPALWPAEALGPSPVTRPAGPRHDAAGLVLLRDVLPGLLDPLLPAGEDGRGWRDSLRSPLLRAIAGHHGRPPEMPKLPPDETVICAACRDAAQDFGTAMAALFAPSPLPVLREAEVDRIAWHLAGLTTLADWIGSRRAWFPYAAPEAVHDPAAYFWDQALPRAAAAIAAAGLAPARPAPFQGLRGLFPIALPSPVQHWAETVALPGGPMLAVIEDLTGSGKTEAALTLAHRLIAAGRANGVFMALPTMATANAMFDRLADACRGLFAAEAHPSLALAHGRAGLDPRFLAAIPAEPNTAAMRRRHADPADEPAEAHCAAWLAEDRRRALLAQVGIGTIDQALLAVLPVRHAALRLQGLAGKVLIIDEAHAFDAYMQREMLTLLEFHAALGGSAVLLSATLPLALRARLVGACRKGLLGRDPRQLLTETAYPLATLASAAGAVEQPCAPRDGLPRRVAVTRLPDADAALERIIAAAKAGAAVAWVRNTVDDAIAAAEALRARGLAPLLFHARFALVDRLAIEREVLRRFGRQGQDRPGVLVATQVVEQSLDLDFDLLVTDLAPADLLIQRAGRLWRHDRGARPVPGPELLVVSPAPVADPPADWIRAAQPGTAAVYRDPALLWRSARAVFARGAIETPGDMRPLIEAAAADERPAALARAAQEAEGKVHAETEIARQNLLSFRGAYDREAGLWELETRTPTRLEDRPSVTLRLAVERQGWVMPYADGPDPSRAWALSEVAVARHRIAACLVPAGLEVAAEEARAGWGRLERESDRILLGVLTPRGNEFTMLATADSGEPVMVRYDPHAGLSLHAPVMADEPARGSAASSLG